MNVVRRFWPLAVILFLYFVLGAAYAMRIPAWQGPDEPAHYNYTRQLVETGQLPVIETSDWNASLVPIAPENRDVPVARITYEDHQPPLFYALTYPFYIASDGNLAVLRLVSLAIAATTVIMAYLCTLVIAPENISVAAFAAATVAFLPQHLFMMASYNNDALSEALLATTLWLVIRRLMSQTDEMTRPTMLGMTPDLIIIALTVGACMLTKAQAYLALPLAVCAVAFIQQSHRRRALANGARTAILAAIVPAMWWGRNANLYGGLDLLGLQRHNLVVTGQLTTATAITLRGIAGWLTYVFQTGFQSFWGQFGWMSIPLNQQLYTAMLAVSVATIIVIVLWWIKPGARGAQQRHAFFILALLAVMTLGAFVWYNAQFVQAQGRYLFPALVPIAVAGAFGWHHVSSPWKIVHRWLWLVPTLALCLLDAYLLVRVILPAMRAV